MLNKTDFLQQDTPTVKEIDTFDTDAKTLLVKPLPCNETFTISVTVTSFETLKILDEVAQTEMYDSIEELLSRRMKNNIRSIVEEHHHNKEYDTRRGIEHDLKQLIILLTQQNKQ